MSRYARYLHISKVSGSYSLSPQFQICDQPSFLPDPSLLNSTPLLYFLFDLGSWLSEIALAQRTPVIHTHNLPLEHKSCESRSLGSVHSCMPGVMSGTKESSVHLVNESKFQFIIKFFSVKYHVPLYSIRKCPFLSSHR